MRTLFIINTVGLYFHSVLILLRFVVWDPTIPFARDAASMSFRLDMYTFIVFFAVFAILGFIALWQGVVWSRGRLAVIIIPPVVSGSLVYLRWWVGGG